MCVAGVISDDVALRHTSSREMQMSFLEGPLGTPPAVASGVLVALGFSENLMCSERDLEHPVDH